MNFLDRTIAFFDPKTALRRVRSRHALNVYDEHTRKYDAASRGRRTKGWRATGGSANTETLAALTTLRNRSRELVRNNPYAKRAIQVIQNNTVGGGIRPAPDASDKAADEELTKRWTDWAELRDCDFDGRHTFYGLQHLAIRAVAESGECLIRRRRRRANGRRIPVQLQLVEADFMDASKDRRSIGGANEIIQGVEFDSQGRRVAYWLYDHHPADAMQLQSKRVPVSEVIHLYHMERPGQVRGVPWGSSAMLRLRDFDDYEDAQLIRQKIAACFTAFVQDSAVDSTPGLGGSGKDLIDKLEPGIIEELPPGKTVQFGRPPEAEGYKDYATKVLQAIAAGYGITYEALTGDMSGVNFSSGRMGWIEMHRNILSWQNHMMIPLLCEPVWQWFVDGMELVGEEVPDHTMHWTPPRREMIDPVKETRAIVFALRNRLISWSEAVRMFGSDPDKLMDAFKKDQEKFDEHDIVSDADPRNSARASGGDRDRETGGDEDERE